MRIPEHDTVPSVLAPGDPCSGDEALPRGGDHRSWIAAGGEGSVAAHAAAELRFERAVVDVLQGDRPWDDPELAELAAWLRVDGPVRHDRRPARCAEQRVPDEILCDITEDLLPDLALVGERVTGDDRPVSVVMGAVLFHVPCAEDGRRPIDRWSDEEPERALVRAARVIDSSPPGLWVHGKALLPLAPPRVPDPASVPAGVFVGRAYRVGDDWAWSACLFLPRAPDPVVLERRLRLELWRLRLVDRRRTWEDVLRCAPEVVYRAACEGAR